MVILTPDGEETADEHTEPREFGCFRCSAPEADRFADVTEDGGRILIPLCRECG